MRTTLRYNENTRHNRNCNGDDSRFIVCPRRVRAYKYDRFGLIKKTRFTIRRSLCALNKLILSEVGRRECRCIYIYYRLLSALEARELRRVVVDFLRRAKRFSPGKCPRSLRERPANRSETVMHFHYTIIRGCVAGPDDNDRAPRITVSDLISRRKASARSSRVI